MESELTDDIGTDRRAISVTVNGTRCEAEVEVRKTLADFLREDAGLPASTWAASTASAAPARC